MRFKIIRREEGYMTWYYTIPIGFFNCIYHVGIVSISYLFSDRVPAYNLFSDLERAKKHIRKWNNGDYKKEEVWKSK